MQLLILLNRLRSGPATEALRLAPIGIDSDPHMGKADLAVFRREMAELPPVPPLIMHPRLIAAARSHARYLLRNGLVPGPHHEQPGLPGFSGVDPAARIFAARYPRRVSGENVSIGMRSMEWVHAGLAIDWDETGSTPDGYQVGRGHRVNMARAQFREVGMGVVTVGHATCAVQVFADRKGERFAGGVVSSDRNGNGLYDPGEGMGGVAIVASDGSRTVTAASGSWSLELSTTSSLRITASRGTLSETWSVPVGAANAWRVWRIESTQDQHQAAALIAAVKSATPGTQALRKAQIDLLMIGRRLSVTAPQMAEIESLIGDAGLKLAADQQAVRAVFADDAALEPVLKRAQETWKGTAAEAWFAGVPAFRGAQTVSATLAAAIAAGPIPDTWPDQTVAKLRWLQAKTTEPEWRVGIQRMIEQAQQFVVYGAPIDAPGIGIGTTHTGPPAPLPGGVRRGPGGSLPQPGRP